MWNLKKPKLTEREKIGDGEEGRGMGEAEQRVQTNFQL